MIAKLNRRYLIIAVLGLALLIVLAVAPTYNIIQSGSTWSKEPDGYGAWFEYMEQRGAPIERWQRPIGELLKEAKKRENSDAPATIVRIFPPSVPPHNIELSDWIKRGDRVVVLSRSQPVQAAIFETRFDTDVGEVLIETRSRNDYEDVESILSDEYGSVVWKEDFAAYIDPEDESAATAGDYIQSTVPYLAANAYLGEPGNFAFLAELVESGGPIYVDEYLHGYRDADVVVEEVAGTWFDYLAQTPLQVVVLQSAIILLITIIAQNRRMGLARSLKPEPVNNSEAYIMALAGVLNKANSQDFLIKTLVKAEQKALQRSLGLGEVPVPLNVLKTAWQQTTGRSPAELNILTAKPRGNTAIQQWLKRIQQLHLRANQPIKASQRPQPEQDS